MYIGCKEKKRYPEINILHVLGAMMILLCHFTQKSHLSAVSELFITGVPLFLFVSGFLAALKPTHGKDWFLKRCTRILTPYYLWIIPGLCILLISSRDVVSPFQAIIIMLNLQGLNYFFWKFDHYVAVIGFGHLWFLTKIMFCYALVPILDVTVRQWIGLKTKWGGDFVMHPDFNCTDNYADAWSAIELYYNILLGILHFSNRCENNGFLDRKDYSRMHSE